MHSAALGLEDMLKIKMQYDSQRQKVLAANIANKGVPDFRAHDLVPLDFKNVLAAETSKVNLAATSPRHLSGVRGYTQRFLETQQKNSFEVDSTGNNISTEEQMMKVAQNSIDYQMSTSLYKKVGNLFKEALGLQPSS